MKYYLDIDDGYSDGLYVFNTKQEALDFILHKLSKAIDRKLSDFTLIEGKKLILQPVEIITKLKAE